MRLFFGLDLDSRSKLAIEQWRETALPGFDHAVPPANFHVTSVFLGQVSAPQLEPIINEVDALQARGFSLTFDQLGYWSKPGVLFLACSSADPLATDLSEQLTRIARRQHLDIPNRPYVPHITLARKVKTAPPAALTTADFRLSFDRLHLFESVSGSAGVRYVSRQQWPLRG